MKNFSKGVNVTKQDLRKLRLNHEEHEEEIICHRCHKKTKEVRNPSQNVSSQSQEHNPRQDINSCIDGPSNMEIVIGDVKSVPKRKHQKIYVRDSYEIGRHDEIRYYQIETETRKVQYDASEWKELSFFEEPKRLMVDASVGSTHSSLHKIYKIKGYQTRYKGHIRHNKKNYNKRVGVGGAESRKKMQVHQKMSPININNICLGTNSPISITASVESNHATEAKGQVTSIRVNQVVYNSTFTLEKNRSDTEESKPTLESEAVDDSDSMIAHRGHEESFTIHKSFNQLKEESSDKLVKNIYKRIDINCSEHTKETYPIGGKISSRKLLITKLKEKRKEQKTRVSSVVSKESKLTDKSSRGSKLSLSLRRRFEALRRRLGIKEERLNNDELSPKIKLSSHYCPSFKDVAISSDPPSLIARPYLYSRQDISCNTARVKFKFWGKFFFNNEPKRDKCSRNVKVKESQTKQAKKIKIKNDKKDVSASNENAANVSGILAMNNITACRCDVKSIMKIKGSDNLNASVVEIPNSDSKNEEKYAVSWLDKFVLNNSESNENKVIVRWENITCHKRSSSSTIFELMDCLYKDTGLDFRSSDMPRKRSQKEHNPYHQILPTFVVHSCEYKLPIIKETPLSIKHSKDRNKSKNKQLAVSKNTWIFETKSKESLKTQMVLHAMYKNGHSFEYYRIDIPSGGLYSGSRTDRSNSKQGDERVFQVVNYDTPGSSKIAEIFMKAIDYEDLERKDRNSSFALPECSTVLKIVDFISASHIEPETSVLKEAKTESMKNCKLIDSVDDYGYHQETSQSYANAWRTYRNPTKSRLDVDSKSCPNMLENYHAYIDKYIDDICDNTCLKQSKNTVLTKRLKKIWQRLQRKTAVSDTLIDFSLRSLTSCLVIGEYETSVNGTSSKAGILDPKINKDNEIIVSISTTGGYNSQQSDHSQRIESLHQVEIEKRGNNVRIRKEKVTREANSPQRQKPISDDTIQKTQYTTLASTDSLSIVIQDPQLIKLLLSSFVQPSKKKLLTVSHSAQRSNLCYESISTQYSAVTKTRSQPNTHSQSTQDPYEKPFRIPKETQFSAPICCQRSQSATDQQKPSALGSKTIVSCFNSKSEHNCTKMSKDIYKSPSNIKSKVLQCPRHKSKETIRQSLCKIKGHFDEHPFCTLKSIFEITPCPSKSSKNKSDKKEVICDCAEEKSITKEEISIFNKSSDDSLRHEYKNSINSDNSTRFQKSHSKQIKHKIIVVKGSICACPETSDHPLIADDTCKDNENSKDSSDDSLRHDLSINSDNSPRFQKSGSKHKREKETAKKGSKCAYPESNDHTLKADDTYKDNENSKKSSDGSSINSDNSQRCACPQIIIISRTDDVLTPSKKIDSHNPEPSEKSIHISSKHYPSLVFLPSKASHIPVPSNKLKARSKPKDSVISCLCKGAQSKVRDPNVYRDKFTSKMSRSSAGKDKQYSVSGSFELQNEYSIKTPHLSKYPPTDDPSTGHSNETYLPDSSCFSTAYTSSKSAIGRECEDAKYLPTDQNEQAEENEKAPTFPEVVPKQSAHINVEKTRRKQMPSKISTLNSRPYVSSFLSDSFKRDITTSSLEFKTFTQTNENKNPKTIEPSVQRRLIKAAIHRNDVLKPDCPKRRLEPLIPVNDIINCSDVLTLKPETILSEAPKPSLVNAFHKITKVLPKASPKREDTKLHIKSCKCPLTVPAIPKLTDFSYAVDQPSLATDCNNELPEFAPKSEEFHEDVLRFAPYPRFDFNPGVTDYRRTTAQAEQKCLPCFGNTRKVVTAPIENNKTTKLSEAAKSSNKTSESANITKNTNSTSDLSKSIKSESIVSQETCSNNKGLPSSPSCSCNNKKSSKEFTSKARFEEAVQSFQEQSCSNKSDSTEKSDDTEKSDRIKKLDNKNDTSKYRSDSGMTTENIEHQRSSMQTTNESFSKSWPEETSQRIQEKSTQEKSCIDKLKLFLGRRKKLDCSNVVSKGASCDSKLTTQNAREQIISNNTSKETSQGSDQNSCTKKSDSSKKSDLNNVILRDVSCYSRVATENAEQQCSTTKTSNKYTSKSRSEVTSDCSKQKLCRKRLDKKAFSYVSLKDVSCESRITIQNVQEQFPSRSNCKDTSTTSHGIFSSKKSESSNDTSTTVGYRKRIETHNAGLQCSRHTDPSTKSVFEDRSSQQKPCNIKSDKNHDISNAGRVKRMAAQNAGLQCSRHTSGSGSKSRSEEIVRSTKQSCRDNIDYNIKSSKDISGESRTTILRWSSDVCPKFIKDSTKLQRQTQKTEGECVGCYDHTCKNDLCTGCSDSTTVTNLESSLNDKKSTPCSSENISYEFSSKNQSEQTTQSANVQCCSKKAGSLKNTSYYSSLKTQAKQQCLPCFDHTCMNDYCPSRIIKKETAISTKQPSDTKNKKCDDTLNTNCCQSPKNEASAIKKAIFDDMADLVHKSPEDISGKKIKNEDVTKKEKTKKEQKGCLCSQELKNKKEKDQQESSEDSSENKQTSEQKECPCLQESQKKKDKYRQESSENSSKYKQTSGRCLSKVSKPEEVASKKENMKNIGKESTEESGSFSIDSSEKQSNVDYKIKKKNKESGACSCSDKEKEINKKKEKYLCSVKEGAKKNKRDRQKSFTGSCPCSVKGKKMKINYQDAEKGSCSEKEAKKIKNQKDRESDCDEGCAGFRKRERVINKKGRNRESNSCSSREEIKKNKIGQNVSSGTSSCSLREKKKNKNEQNADSCPCSKKEGANKKKNKKEKDSNPAEYSKVNSKGKCKKEKINKKGRSSKVSCEKSETVSEKSDEDNEKDQGIKKGWSCSEDICKHFESENKTNEKDKTKSKDMPEEVSLKLPLTKLKSSSSKSSESEIKSKCTPNCPYSINHIPKKKQIKEVHCECSEALLEEKKKMEMSKPCSNNELEQCSYDYSKLVNCGCQTVSDGTTISGTTTKKQELACGDLNNRTANISSARKNQPASINFNETVQTENEGRGKTGDKNESGYSVTYNKNSFQVRDDEGRLIVERRNYRANEKVEISDDDDKSDKIVEIRLTLKIDQADKTKEFTIDKKNDKAIEMHPQTSKHDMYYFHDQDKTSPQHKTKPSDVTVRITVRNISHEGNQTNTFDVENKSADRRSIMPIVFDVEEAEGCPSFIPINSRTKPYFTLSATISQLKSSSSENRAITLIDKHPKDGISDQPFVYDDLNNPKMKGTTSAPNVYNKWDKYTARKSIVDKTKTLYDKNDLRNEETVKRRDNDHSIFVISSAEDASNEWMRVRFVSLEPKELKNTDSMNNYYIMSTTTSETTPSSFQPDINKELPEWCSDISYRNNKSWNRLKKCVCTSFARKFNLQEIESSLRDEKRCYCKQQQVVEERTSCDLTSDYLTSKSDEKPFVKNSRCNRITVSKTNMSAAYLKTKKWTRKRDKPKCKQKRTFALKSNTVLFETTCYQKSNNFGVFKGTKTEKVKKINESDVLQSYAMKKAVLEIYRENNSTNDDDLDVALVDNLPKFLDDKDKCVNYTKEYNLFF